MAKAGHVMEAKFPRAYAQHGGEHVVSLLYDDLSKHKVVKVRFSCFIIYFKCSDLLTYSLLRLLLLNAASCIIYLGLG